MPPRVGSARPTSLDEVAAAVVFFATCPRYITGQILAMDGGEGVGA
jgi:NAD(P)-dependent dehydrogenase (short-subunit alcohol dehydrogenase family)